MTAIRDDRESDKKLRTVSKFERAPTRRSCKRDWNGRKSAKWPSQLPLQDRIRVTSALILEMGEIWRLEKKLDGEILGLFSPSLTNDAYRTATLTHNLIITDRVM